MQTCWLLQCREVGRIVSLFFQSFFFFFCVSPRCLGMSWFVLSFGKSFEHSNSVVSNLPMIASVSLYVLRFAIGLLWRFQTRG